MGEWQGALESMGRIMGSILNDDLEYINRGLSERGKLEGATIVITGCAGFLGYYFLNYFLSFAEANKVKRVIGLDNFLCGRPKWLERLSREFPKQFSLVNFDISKGNIASIEGAIDADYVVHMASVASPMFYRKYPIETLDANIWGLRDLLDTYKDRKIRGVLFFSSSEIYGDPVPEAVPTNEEYRGNVSCLGPRACYDESKRFGETMCYLFANRYNMPIAIARPFNNYGPGMKLNDQRVPADFAKAVIGGRDITILSDGTPTRTFCYVADAVLGYLKVLLHGSFDYFNIGIESPEITVKQLAEIYIEKARELFGYKGKVVAEKSLDPNYLVHNPKRRCPDISKARRLLHYEPTIKVNEGVGRFLRYVKECGEAV